MRKRPLNVLILLGSPREDGNSTRLAFAFADAASRNGHAVQTIRRAHAVQPVAALQSEYSLWWR